MRLIVKVHPYYAITSFYVILSLILGRVLSNGLITFLGWNILLATSVFLVSQLINNQYKKNIKKTYLIILYGIYILLFPNTIYVLTDFIHFQNYDFFASYPDIYTLQINDWLVFGHIIIGALYAAKLGIVSLKNISVIFEPYPIKIYYIGLSILFMLSSLGIYIGRFLRFNSWNVFAFFNIIRQIFEQGVFLVNFVLIFFFIHWVSYFILTEQKN